MERGATNKDKVSLNDSDERPRCAVNAAVLDYYKKFGRKRDLEQYFSLSTAQSEISDPSSLFWRKMKEQSDTSDSGEKKSESSNEICRISIQCSIPQVDTQRENSPPKSDSDSPPIITDVLPGLSHSGDDSIDDNNSHKSIDGTFDTSINKPLSPTSSITSQRKLEWDSLADVGYGNESDRKTSASSLSTLEREILAQRQQYTLDFKQNSDLGLPTAHSTPVDPNEIKSKKKGQGKKTSFSKKDVDIVEVNVPHISENAPAINVNLSKQFSVNLGRDGGITVDTGKNNVTVIPETKCVDTEISPAVRLDKEIQTTLLRSKERVQSSADCLETEFTSQQNVPVYICFNTIKRRHKRKKVRKLRSRNVIRKRSYVKKKPVQEKEKSGEQVSEAESFEYMPGHMYNQNQLNENSNMPSNTNAGNKSSLESSAVHTTDSSKESKCSFTKELNKSLDVLKLALKDKYDSNLKKKLVREVIQRLLKSNYADDGSTPEFISVLSLLSKKTPTTSTSEADNSGEKILHTKPKKSILRNNRFNSKDIASTSQSAPNIPLVMNSENPVLSYLPKQASSTSTDTDPSANYSAKELSSSDTVFAKTSSEELLKKYIDALKKEEAYKQHLKDKHLFLRQKLLRSDTGLKVPVQLDLKTNNKLKDLIKDLTRNNYDDGSGDARKLEGGSSSNIDIHNSNRSVRKQRSHSVFTLSSGNPNLQNRNCYPKHNEQEISASSRAGPSHHLGHIEPYKQHTCKQSNVADSSVQVSIKCIEEPEKKHSTEVITVPIRTITGHPALTEDVNYVCLCTEKSITSQNSPEEFLIYKCSKLPGNMTSTGSNTVNVPYVTKCTSPKQDSTTSSTKNKSELKLDEKPQETGSMTNFPLLRKLSKSSQTNNCANSHIPHRLCARSTGSSSSEHEINNGTNTCSKPKSNDKKKYIIKESTRCLQTEISIHPKISDPALSDVNIINSAECVKLISELYRKVSRSSSEHNIPHRSSDNNEADTCSKSSKANIHLWDKQSQDNLSSDERDIAPIMNQPLQCCCYSTIPQLENNSDKIIIPIDGTNMTLKVSIAGKSSSLSLNTKKNQSQTETPCSVDSKNKEITSNTENYTCISAECSKAVQSENVRNIFPNNECYLNEGKPVEGLRSNTYKLVTNTDGIKETNQSNTYPKTIPIKDHKLFLRHNTEILINTEAVRPIRSVIDNNADDENKGDKETEYAPKKLIVASKKQSNHKGNSDLQSLKCNETTSDHNNVLENPEACSQNKGRSSTLYVPESKSLKSNMAKEDGTTNDMILDMIQDITKRYSKKVSEKSNKKKCYEEILRVLDYLLDTDDSGDSEKELAKDSQSSEEQPRVSETLSNQSSPDTGSLHKLTEKKSNLKKIINPYKTMYKEYALQCVNTTDNLENSSTSPVSYESIKIPENKGDEQSDANKESLKQNTDGVGKEFSVYMKQGFHDYSGAKKKRSKQKSDEGSKELSVYTDAEKTCPETCSIACGCDEPECKDRSERGNENYKTEPLKATLRSLHHDTKENDKQTSESSKPKTISGLTKLKTDVGQKIKRKPDVDNKKSLGYEKLSSFRKKYETLEIPAETSEAACVFHEPECKDRSGNYKTDITKTTLRSIRHETDENDKQSPESPKSEIITGLPKLKTVEDQTMQYKNRKPDEDNKLSSLYKKHKPLEIRPETWDVSRGRDKPEYKDRSKRGDENYKTKMSKATLKSVHHETEEIDMESSESLKSESSAACTKLKTDEGRQIHCKQRKPDVANMKSLVYEKSSSVCKQHESQKNCPKTCDVACGCNEPDCQDRSNRGNENYKTDTTKQTLRSVHQETEEPLETKSEQLCPQFCDKACGCDEPSSQDISELGVEKYKTDITKRTYKSLHEETNEILSNTCDKGVGCDDSLESKDSSSCDCIKYIKTRCDHKGCKKHKSTDKTTRNLVSKCVQSTARKVKLICTQRHCSLQCPISSDQQSICTDSPTAKIIKKIRKECEKYQKRPRTCINEVSSSTSANCEHCNRANWHCSCRGQKCRGHQTRTKTEKIKKKCVAYNLLLQTSDSVASEEQTEFDRHCRPMQNIIIKVPKQKQEYVPFKELSAKIEQNFAGGISQRCCHLNRSRSWPHEGGISSTDDVKMAQARTVRDYLESNRPDFVERCTDRQNCIRTLSRSRASERSKQVEVLSMQLRGLRPQTLTEEEMRQLAKEVGLGQRRTQPKLFSEREMKKHSEKIYKSLPEVRQKKEDARKESIKRTNLLMASLFKKNLQKKTLRGAVNLSNYSAVIKL